MIAAPLVFLALFGGKVISKIFGLYPVIGRFRESKKERWYYTLLMSTGLTFGSISALYGLTHGIVSPRPVFIPDRGSHRERGDSDAHRQPGLSARASAESAHGGRGSAAA